MKAPTAEELASAAAQALGRLRFAGKRRAEAARIGAKGGRSAWAGMSEGQRSAELKRRAKRRKPLSAK